MIAIRTYRFFLLSLLILFISGCGQRLNRNYTLWRNDKIPYGTKYAFDNLKYMFNDAEIITSKASPEAFAYDENTGEAFVVVGYRVLPSGDEVNAILNHIYSGNEVFISALEIGDNLLDSFGLKASWKPVSSFRDSMTVSIYDSDDDENYLFTYPGIGAGNYFSQLDTSITTILGQDSDKRANFVRITYEGGGAAILHLAPTTFTNFFLLHKKNKHYYDVALSTLSDSVTTVRWDDYFRYHSYGQNRSERSVFDKLSQILKHEVLRWAFWLTLLLFAIIFLFESKRKQRVIPAVKQLSNTSLDFVKTIGRLYFQRKDNKNLAAKMTTHFLGHVRTRYNINTSHLNEEFEKRLAYKSGFPQEDVRAILASVHQFETAATVSDEVLMRFHEKLDKFYKQT